MQTDPNLSVTPTYETGVFLALNAAPNAIAVLSSPRCSFFRSLKVSLVNDIFGSLYSASGKHRLITTEWQSYEDVTGDEERFAETLRQAFQLYPEEWVLTFQNISSCLAGFDLAGISKQIAGEAKRDVLVLDGPTLRDDWLGGYAQVVRAFASRLLREDGRPVDLAVVGHLLARNERDDLENVAELRRLLAGIGVQGPVVLLSGEPVPTEPIRPKLLVVHPYAGPGPFKDTESCRVGLPVGLRGTRTWLEAIAKALGREEQARAFIDDELGSLVPDIKWPIVEHFVNKHAVVVADPYFGEALVDCLEELGIVVRGFFCLSKNAPPSLRDDVVLNPTPEEFDAHLRRLRSEHGVDLIVGSDVFLELEVAREVPYVVLGFPSYTRHALFPSPTYGFRGARFIANELLNALMRG